MIHFSWCFTFSKIRDFLRFGELSLFKGVYRPKGGWRKEIGWVFWSFLERRKRKTIWKPKIITTRECILGKISYLHAWHSVFKKVMQSFFCFMKKTVIIDILNEKVLKLLQDLELLKLIRLRSESENNNIESNPSNSFLKFKGAMTKQTKSEIDNQFNQLRSEWDWRICGIPTRSFIIFNNNFRRELRNLLIVLWQNHRQLFQSLQKWNCFAGKRPQKKI